MKARVISACVALVIMAAVLSVYDTLVLNAAISAVSVMAVYELLIASGYRSNRSPIITCMVFAGLLPFITVPAMSHLVSALFCTLAFTLFIIQLAQHKTLKIEQVGFIFLISVMIPASLSLTVRARDELPGLPGLFYVLLMLCGAWMTDTGAFFVGSTLGKHKLAPTISPKKTVEGAVGGAVICTIGFLLIGAIFSRVTAGSVAPMQIDYLKLALLGPLCGAAAVTGDLVASVIKRQCGVKDFGGIMPGHGGVMDRFDSVLFVAPVVFLFMRYLPIVAV